MQYDYYNDDLVFADDHIRITPCSLKELDSASPEEIARMALRVIVNNHRLLYRQIRSDWYQYCLRMASRYDIEHLTIGLPGDTVRADVVPHHVYMGWKNLLRKLVFPQEQRLEQEKALIDDLGEQSLDEYEHDLRGKIRRLFPRWKSMLSSDYTQDDGLSQPLTEMTYAELEALPNHLNEAEVLHRHQMRFAREGDCDPSAS